MELDFSGTGKFIAASKLPKLPDMSVFGADVTVPVKRADAERLLFDNPERSSSAGDTIEISENTDTEDAGGNAAPPEPDKKPESGDKPAPRPPVKTSETGKDGGTDAETNTGKKKPAPKTRIITEDRVPLTGYIQDDVTVPAKPAQKGDALTDTASEKPAAAPDSEPAPELEADETAVPDGSRGFTKTEQNYIWWFKQLADGNGSTVPLEPAEPAEPAVPLFTNESGEVPADSPHEAEDDNTDETGGLGGGDDEETSEPAPEPVEIYTVSDDIESSFTITARQGDKIIKEIQLNPNFIGSGASDGSVQYSFKDGKLVLTTAAGSDVIVEEYTPVDGKKGGLQLETVTLTDNAGLNPDTAFDRTNPYAAVDEHIKKPENAQ